MDPILFDNTPELFPFFSIARVEQSISSTHRGRVAWQGTSWFAQFYDATCQVTTTPGAIVLVLGRQGNTLLVLPDGYRTAFLQDRRRSPRTLAESSSGGLGRSLTSLFNHWFG